LFFWKRIKNQKKKMAKSGKREFHWEDAKENDMKKYLKRKFNLDRYKTLNSYIEIIVCIILSIIGMIIIDLESIGDEIILLIIAIYCFIFFCIYILKYVYENKNTSMNGTVLFGIWLIWIIYSKLIGEISILNEPILKYVLHTIVLAIVVLSYSKIFIQTNFYVVLATTFIYIFIMIIPHKDSSIFNLDTLGYCIKFILFISVYIPSEIEFEIFNETAMYFEKLTRRKLMKNRILILLRTSWIFFAPNGFMFLSIGLWYIQYMIYQKMINVYTLPSKKQQQPIIIQDTQSNPQQQPIPTQPITEIKKKSPKRKNDV